MRWTLERPGCVPTLEHGNDPALNGFHADF
jgi:hypothetical protein